MSATALHYWRKPLTALLAMYKMTTQLASS